MRRGAIGAVTATVALAGVACDLEPVAHLLVTTQLDRADAAPGDGVCEMDAGQGNCSLRAAVDEGNALGVALITVPAGTYGGEALTITGELSVNVGADHDFELRKAVNVAPGGALAIEGAYHGINVSAPWRVEGLLLAARVSLVSAGSTGPRLTVAPGGFALLESSLLADGFGPTPTIRNEGWLALRAVLVEGYANHALEAADGAITFLDSTVISRPQLGAPGPACSGLDAISIGHNIASDDSCDLSATTDLESTPPLIESTSGGGLAKWTVLFRPGSPALDAIPVGTHGCGPFSTRDLERNARPADGDGDGVAACDLGPVELQP